MTLILRDRFFLSFSPCCCCWLLLLRFKFRRRDHNLPCLKKTVKATIQWQLGQTGEGRDREKGRARVFLSMFSNLFLLSSLLFKVYNLQQQYIKCSNEIIMTEKLFFFVWVCTYRNRFEQGMGNDSGWGGCCCGQDEARNGASGVVVEL